MRLSHCGLHKGCAVAEMLLLANGYACLCKRIPALHAKTGWQASHMQGCGQRAKGTYLLRLLHLKNPGCGPPWCLQQQLLQHQPQVVLCVECGPSLLPLARSCGCLHLPVGGWMRPATPCLCFVIEALRSWRVRGGEENTTDTSACRSHKRHSTNRTENVRDLSGILSGLHIAEVDSGVYSSEVGASRHGAMASASVVQVVHARSNPPVSLFSVGEPAAGLHHSPYDPCLKGLYAVRDEELPRVPRRWRTARNFAAGRTAG